MTLNEIPRFELQFKVEQLSRDYVSSIDGDSLEIWPGFFTEDGLYEVISRSNVERGLPAHAMRCEGVGMMRDRVVSLREANIFAEQQYRHLVSNIDIRSVGAEGIRVLSNYLVARTLTLTGEAEIFSIGKYSDWIVPVAGELKYKERRVIFDNERIHSLMAIPL